ncbi:MAG: hypothetical protein MR861_10400, partial [Clostridiales bacterium]|nr:hypothetical protein [Clostridiales bacterium]
MRKRSEDTQKDICAKWKAPALQQKIAEQTPETDVLMGSGLPIQEGPFFVLQLGTGFYQSLTGFG